MPLPNEHVQSLLQKFLTLQDKPVHLDPQGLEVFLSAEINGDVVIDSLVLSATLGEGRVGILAYILTNAKLIKIEIDAKESKSFPIYLRDVLGVKRVFPGPTGSDRARISVESAQSSFALSYPVTNQTIDQFFRKVDERVREAKTSQAT